MQLKVDRIIKKHIFSYLPFFNYVEGNVKFKIL